MRIIRVMLIAVPGILFFIVMRTLAIFRLDQTLLAYLTRDGTAEALLEKPSGIPVPDAPSELHPDRPVGSEGSFNYLA